MTELKRVLKPTGSCWINLGDSYAGSGCGTPSEGSIQAASKFWKESNASAQHAIQKTKVGVQAKSRYGIPERFYIDCIDNGFIARNIIPWIKGNPMPQSIKDRFSNVWESIFFFTKNNIPIFHFNEKTGVSDIAPKSKTELVGGVDWEYRECISCAGTGYTKNDQVHKRCKGNGIYRYSFWYARDYYFNLDPVREKTITESKPFNIRVRDNKKGRGQAKLTGGMSDGEDKMYDDKGILLSHTSSKKQDNTLGADGKPKATMQGFNARYAATAHRKSVNTPYAKGVGGQGISKRNSHGYDIETGESLNHSNGKNPGDVFYINVKPFAEGHFAVYPVQLVERILKCACPQQVCSSCGVPRYPIPKSDDFTKCKCNKPFHPGITLDPFMGAGTTAVAAEQLGLRWVGIEINQEYIDIAKRRLEPYQFEKFDNNNNNITEEDEEDISIE